MLTSEYNLQTVLQTLVQIFLGQKMKLSLSFSEIFLICLWNGHYFQWSQLITRTFSQVSPKMPCYDKLTLFSVWHLQYILSCGNIQNKSGSALFKWNHRRTKQTLKRWKHFRSSFSSRTSFTFNGGDLSHLLLAHQWSNKRHRT